MPPRIKKPKYVFTPETLARLATPVPEVTLQYHTVYDRAGNTRQLTEESVEFDRLSRDAHDNAYLSSWITYEGKNYRQSTLEIAHNALTCGGCYAVCARSHLIDNRCTDCRKETERICGKGSPDSGWRRFGTGTPYFGIEFECELPKLPSGANGVDTFKEVIKRAEWYLPVAYTSDSSLVHGVELNTHMMTLEYLKTNNHLITHSIGQLKAAGASHLAGIGTLNERETSGLHVHVDIGAINVQHESKLYDWLKAIRPFLMQFSFRSADKFEYYCEGGYKYFGQRNKIQTWECRGFSSRILLEHPEALPHICAWVDTLCYVSRNPWLTLMTPAQALTFAGHAETATYIRDVLEVTEIDTPGISKGPMPDLTRYGAQAVQLDNESGPVVWFREVTSRSSSYFNCYNRMPYGDRWTSDSQTLETSRIVKWFTHSPPPPMALDEYKIALAAVSEVKPESFITPVAAPQPAAQVPMDEVKTAALQHSSDIRDVERYLFARRQAEIYVDTSRIPVPF